MFITAGLMIERMRLGASDGEEDEVGGVGRQRESLLMAGCALLDASPILVALEGIALLGISFFLTGVTLEMALVRILVL